MRGIQDYDHEHAVPKWIIWSLIALLFLSDEGNVTDSFTARLSVWGGARSIRSLSIFQPIIDFAATVSISVNSYSCLFSTAHRYPHPLCGPMLNGCQTISTQRTDERSLSPLPWPFRCWASEGPCTSRSTARTCTPWSSLHPGSCSGSDCTTPSHHMTSHRHRISWGWKTWGREKSIPLTDGYISRGSPWKGSERTSRAPLPSIILTAAYNTTVGNRPTRYLRHDIKRDAGRNLRV